MHAGACRTSWHGSHLRSPLLTCSLARRRIDCCDRTAPSHLRTRALIKYLGAKRAYNRICCCVGAGLLPWPSRSYQSVMLMCPLALPRIDGHDRVVPSLPLTRAVLGYLVTIFTINCFCCVLAGATSNRRLRLRRSIASAHAGSCQISWHVSCSQSHC
jgi:hypothetical protein